MDEIKQYINTLPCNKGNKIIILVGNRIEDKIFNCKRDYGNFNIIPLITSLFETRYRLYQIDEYFHLDSKLEITNSLQNKIQNKAHTINKLIQYNIQNIGNSDILAKFIKEDKHSLIDFVCSDNYNHLQNFTRIIWNLNKEVKIHLDIFKEYQQLYLVINLKENVKIIPERKKYIDDILDLLGKLISYLDLNND
jgi:hypothetical protein